MAKLDRSTGLIIFPYLYINTSNKILFVLNIDILLIKCPCMCIVCIYLCYGYMTYLIDKIYCQFEPLLNFSLSHSTFYVNIQ